MVRPHIIEVHADDWSKTVTLFYTLDTPVEELEAAARLHEHAAEILGWAQVVVSVYDIASTAYDYDDVVDAMRKVLDKVYES